MNRGYIALWRKLQDNQFWKERRVFSKAEAWIDILMEVRAKEDPIDVVIGNKVLTCNYAESLHSLETWAYRWHWSKSKVKRVLDLFQSCSMIVIKSETVTTRIKVLKYSEYDIKRNAYETQMKRKRNASETDVEPNKNVKNVKKEKNNPPTPHIEIPEWLNRESWEEYRTHRVSIKSRMSLLSEKKIINQLEAFKNSGFDPVEIINTSIANGWKGVFQPKDNGTGMSTKQKQKDGKSFWERLEEEDKKNERTTIQ